MTYRRIRDNHPLGTRNWATALLTTCILFPCISQARDIHVGIDPEFPTIASAISQSKPGDTIHLEPKVYRESAVFSNRNGEEGKPITLDGHGAILDGSEPLKPEDWKEIEPSLFANDSLLPNFRSTMLGRWFFLWNGTVQRMGIASKASSQKLKDPSELRPGEWTFVRETDPEAPADSKRVKGRFYLKIHPGKSLAEEKIFVPTRMAGVALSGSCSYLVVRNVQARYPWNDGFNIHDHCDHVLFENISAYGCGDDGISAHETAEYHVKGLISVGNSTGICDVGQSQTSYERVFIADSVSIDLFFVDHGRHQIRNALIHSSAQRSIEVAGRTGESQLTLENVWFQRLEDPRIGKVNEKGKLEGMRCTFEGLTFENRGKLQWEKSRVDGVPSDEGARGADLEALRSLQPSH